MGLKRFLFLFCLLLCSFKDVNPPKIQEQFLSIEDVQYDLKYLRCLLEKAHPSIYRYQSKKIMDSIFDRMVEIHEPVTDKRLWEVAQTAIAQIGCGHTSVVPSLRKNVKGPQKYVLPFFIKIINDQLFISKYIQSPGLNSYKIKDEIISINGLPSKVILQKLRRFIQSDGNSVVYKDFRLQNGLFNTLYADFLISSPDMRLKISRGSQVKDFDFISKVTYNRFFELTSKKATEYPSLIFPSEISSTGLIRIRDFQYTNFSNVHKKWFKVLADNAIQNLIIDLRNNSGGSSDVAIDLMKYLQFKKFRFTQITEGVVDFDEFTSKFSTGYYPSYSIVKSLPSRRFQREYAGNKLQVPIKDGFKGNIFILINGGTFSSAVLFATAMKNQGTCVLIGEETGGGRFGCNGGMILNITLPKTALRLKLPLMWTYSPGEDLDYGKGLIPDYYIIAGITAIDTEDNPQRDLILAKSFNLILSK